MTQNNLPQLSMEMHLEICVDFTDGVTAQVPGFPVRLLC